MLVVSYWILYITLYSYERNRYSGHILFKIMDPQTCSAYYYNLL